MIDSNTEESTNSGKKRHNNFLKNMGIIMIAGNY